MLQFFLITFSFFASFFLHLFFLSLFHCFSVYAFNLKPITLLYLYLSFFSNFAILQIFINALGGAVQKFDVESDATVGEIKKSLGVEESIVSFGPKILDSDVATLESLEIPNEATLDVNVRLLGGKQHGSLARAGKVRAQTLKVDKQEKKKKRGRAFRRIQYNRRFVNVAVSGLGRQRGPNSNQS